MNKQIPIFFATDDNYAPFLAVAINSLVANASKKYVYNIYVLISNLSVEHQEKIGKLANSYVNIEFVDVNKQLEKIKDKLHMRDYYTNATYYRFFVPKMFPQYTKALYLDCDIIVTGDISKLYNHDLRDNYVGAIQEEVMMHENVFGTYVEKVLGIRREKYFNAGILVLNLKKMRNDNIEQGFYNLLSRYTFSVTQDQDYLNVLCKDKVLLVNVAWNKTPIKEIPFDERKLKIAHYKINYKPWHYEGVMFGDQFWKYAKGTVYFDNLMSILTNYTDEQKSRDNKQYEGLKALAVTETQKVIDNNIRPATELETSRLLAEANRVIEEANNLITEVSKKLGVAG